MWASKQKAQNPELSATIRSYLASHPLVPLLSLAIHSIISPESVVKAFGGTVKNQKGRTSFTARAILKTMSR
jgi:hypothetical protein